MPMAETELISSQKKVNILGRTLPLSTIMHYIWQSLEVSSLFFISLKQIFLSELC